MESESTAPAGQEPPVLLQREPTRRMMDFYARKLFGGRARLLFDITRVPPYKVVKRITSAMNQIIGTGATPRAAVMDAVARSKPKGD